MDANHSESEHAEAMEDHIQQLEALGALAGGVAHDFNNLFTVIGGNLEILLSDLALESPLRRYVEASIEAAESGSVLTEQLVTLTRHKPLRPNHVDVHGLLQRSRTLLQTSVGRLNTVSLSSTASACVAYVDPGQLRAALLNLTVNARDAMPDGGRVEVRTSRVAAPGSSDANEDEVLIEIVDSGVGMAPDVLRQATKPFFTTKREGQGSGLGLSTVADFAERSGGRLEVASSNNEGTAVRLYLPAGDPSDIDGRPQTLPRSDRGGGTERLLIVENETAVREMVAQYLSDLGYDVLEAVDGDTALSIFDCGEAIDLALVDIRLNGSPQGDELIAELRERCSKLVLIAMSGDQRVKLADPSVQIVPKPFRLRALAGQLRRALDAAQSADES